MLFTWKWKMRTRTLLWLVLVKLQTVFCFSFDSLPRESRPWHTHTPKPSTKEWNEERKKFLAQTIPKWIMNIVSTSSVLFALSQFFSSCCRPHNCAEFCDRYNVLPIPISTVILCRNVLHLIVKKVKIIWAVTIQDIQNFVFVSISKGIFFLVILFFCWFSLSTWNDCSKKIHTHTK